MSTSIQLLRRRLLILLFPCLLANACAFLDRGRDQTIIAVDGEYASVGNRHFDCDGNVLSEQRDQQAGGRLTVRHETRHGWNVEGSVGVSAGRVEYTSFRLHNPEAGHYTLYSGHGSVGFDSVYFGFDLGYGLVVSSYRSQVIAPPIPLAELRIGRLDITWCEVGLKPPGATFDGRVGYLGLGGRHEWFQVHGGVTALLRPMLDVTELPKDGFGELVAGSWQDGWDVGAYLLATINLTSGFGLRLGVIGAKNPSARLGLSYAF